MGTGFRADPDGLVVCHRYDNRKCVRPDHLFLGTLADNNRDRNAKGRQAHPPPGEKHWNAKLRDCDIPLIREALRRGERQADIAVRFRVSDSLISKVKRGLAGAHVAA